MWWRMGSLWANISKEEIASLYEMSRPTAASIMATLALTPEDAKEAQIFYGWNAYPLLYSLRCVTA